MTFEDHFTVIDDAIGPNEWMQLRLLASVRTPAVAKSYDASDGTAKNEVVQTLSLDWQNQSPISQYVYGMVTRDWSSVALQPRSRAYLLTSHGAKIGAGTIVMSEVSRFGTGADLGVGGLLAINASYGVIEVDSPSSTIPFMPATTGQFLVAPGETLHCKVEVRFKSEFWESGTIGGGDIGTEAKFSAGELELALFASPTIETPPPRLTPSLPGGAGNITHDISFNAPTVVAKPAGLVAGDTLLAIGVTQFGFAETLLPLQSGWTLLHSRNDGLFGAGDVHMKIWGRTIVGGEPSTYSFDGSFFSEGITMLIPLRNTAPVDNAVGSGWSVASNLSHWRIVEDHVTPSLDVDGQLLLAVSYFDHNPLQTPMSQLPPDGMTELVDIPGTISTIALASLASPPRPTLERRFTPNALPLFRGHSIAAALLIPGAYDI